MFQFSSVLNQKISVKDISVQFSIEPEFFFFNKISQIFWPVNENK